MAAGNSAGRRQRPYPRGLGFLAAPQRAETKLQLLTADILNNLQDGQYVPVVISNGTISWFIWLYKTEGKDLIEGYYISCQNDLEGVEQYVGVIDKNFNKLSYEEFADLEGSSCNTDSGTKEVLEDAFNGMLSELGIQSNGISSESTSDEDLTEKALYYYTV